ncbi:type II secretion system F family protein [Aquimarina sp. ERC-38]|uniref:type II secretion system F family protein n=1 Tax=Aquimarina sp. ERC-38 TaxID=2949996 RepID=UPI002245EE04|nr:type II secretion system F family protein [Aquimarina sp. ERC-38]UZO80688.1 type II secretion system F family protein [Aquimarina sp. ERC-38]
MGIDISNIQKSGTIAVKPTSAVNTGFWKKEISFSKKVGAKEKEALYKDLSTLISAGVDFESALTILSKQQKKVHLKLLIDKIKKDVVKGRSFYEALEATGKFSSYEYYSIKIGEETKRLDTVLLELHKYFKRQIKLRKQIISVITYPSFVLILTIGVLYFMLNYVVPMFKSVFNQFDGDLPGLTKKIIILSDKFPLILGMGVLLVLSSILVLKVYGQNSTFRKYRSFLILKIPFFGKLVKTIYLARYCQFLDLLLTSKTSLTESLVMVKKMIGFYPIEVSIDSIHKNVIKGVPLAKAMKQHAIYDYKLVSMVEVAEEINELDTMFSRLANEYDEEVEHKTKMIGVILEPMIILIIGGVVGLIMIAMYAPMFDLSKIINGG